MTELQQLLMIFKILSIPYEADEFKVRVASTDFLFNRNGCFVRATGPEVDLRKAAVWTICTRTDGKYQNDASSSKAVCDWTDCGNFVAVKPTFGALLNAIRHVLGTEYMSRRVWICNCSADSVANHLGAPYPLQVLVERLYGLGYRNISMEFGAFPHGRHDVTVISRDLLDAVLKQANMGLLVWATNEKEYEELCSRGGGDITV